MIKPYSIVIGGSSGMGFACAKSLYALGHNVLIASRSEEKLESAKNDIGDIKTKKIDLLDEQSIASFFSEIDSFDHLIVSAADFISGPFLSLKTQDARHFFDSKFWGSYLAVKYGALKISKVGSITLFSGLIGSKPVKSLSCAAAINGAIESLTRCLALELAPIRINAIAPGTVETPVWDTIPEGPRQDYFKQKAKTLPVGRIGKPDDIAKAAIYLIECSFVTGTVLHVDGGDAIL
jgi:NAD(P)-dependent dehydrogenase (short-subunit alcohol dehydrogenase family)